MVVLCGVLLSVDFLLSEHVTLNIHGESEYIDSTLLARVVTSSLIAPQEFVSYRIGPLVVKVLWIDAASG